MTIMENYIDQVRCDLNLADLVVSPNCIDSASFAWCLSDRQQPLRPRHATGGLNSYFMYMVSLEFIEVN